MEIKIDYEAIYNDLYNLYDRVWSKKEDIATDAIIAAIGDLRIIDWDKFFELMDIAQHDNCSAEQLEALGHLNLHSLTQYNPNDISNSVNFVKDILDGKEPKPLNHYDLSGVILIIGGFIADYHIKE